ncbi:MAG: HlyD family efflux transporter periplasmic adaptor subunit [Synechococcaceae cyanobacterium]
MIRYRQEALDQASARDPLDQPLPLLRPGWWGVLVALLVVSGGALAWGVLGRVPVRLQGRGVLLRPDSLLPVQSRSSGPLLEILSREGGCVRAGQVMARVDQVELRLGLAAAARRLAQLRAQDGEARLQAQRERTLLLADLERLLPFRASGAIAEQTYVDKERDLQRLDGQQLGEASQRQRAINDEALDLARQRAEYARNSVVVAPLSGCVVEKLVQPGAVVTAGTTVFTLERGDRRGELVSLAYFPSQDGKRLKPGQLVRVTPTTTKAQRHGGIQGRILSLRALPVSREALRQRLGLEALVNAIQPAAAPGEPLIEAVTSLRRDPRTRSGYDWGGGPGPDLRLTAGTGTDVSVLVEWRQPISYLIPLLRDVSGIY